MTSEMDRTLNVVIDVLNELRIDLQEFAWLICEQLQIDGTLMRTANRVSKIFFSLF